LFFARAHRERDVPRVETWDEDHGTQRSIYFADPDGLVLEIATPPSDEGLPIDPRAEETVRAFLEG
jgi:hypothetical protein